jgi:hypothetical protein
MARTWRRSVSTALPPEGWGSLRHPDDLGHFFTVGVDRWLLTRCLGYSPGGMGTG